MTTTTTATKVVTTTNTATNKTSPTKAAANSTQQVQTAQSQVQPQQAAQGAQRSTTTATVPIAAAAPTQPAKNAIVVANTGQIVQGAQVRINNLLKLDTIIIRILLTGHILWWSSY